MFKRFRKLLSDKTGVAAVEFAYIAPLLIVALFGTVEVSRAVMMHKRFQRVSAMIGDLVSREQTLGTTAGTAVAQLNGMMESAEQVMYPFSMTSLDIKINSLQSKSDDGSQTRSAWSYDYTSKLTASTCATKSMPAAGMLNPNSSAIVVESSYQFQPLLVNLIPGFKTAMTWNDTITHSPRKGACVSFEDKGCPCAW